MKTDVPAEADGLRWWVSRQEGDEIRYVPLSHLIKVYWRMNAFGVEKNGVRAGYDKTLAKRGHDPFFRWQNHPFRIEYFAR